MSDLRNAEDWQEPLLDPVPRLGAAQLGQFQRLVIEEKQLWGTLNDAAVFKQGHNFPDVLPDLAYAPGTSYGRKLLGNPDVSRLARVVMKNVQDQTGSFEATANSTITLMNVHNCGATEAYRFLESKLAERRSEPQYERSPQQALATVSALLNLDQRDLRLTPSTVTHLQVVIHNSTTRGTSGILDAAVNLERQMKNFGLDAKGSPAYAEVQKVYTATRDAMNITSTTRAAAALSSASRPSVTGQTRGRRAAPDQAPRPGPANAPLTSRLP